MASLPHAARSRIPTVYATLAAPKDPDAPAAFWAQVDRSGKCWMWLGSTRNDYGRFLFKYRQYTAHRVAYEWAFGPIPTRRVLDHLCRTLLCVNPAHLEPVTIRENTLRGYAPPAANARKTTCNSGHEFTEENTYITSQGYRHCRVCHRITEAARRAARGA